ncbi:MAG TPA: hypothetical protein VM888_06455 [Chitinophagaceae bacterium]|nr:hypothetical protein [Chitinophagaceae bacterium]
MQIVHLQFPSMEVLVDYLFMCPDCDAVIDHDAFTLEGTFSLIDIELALNGYSAKAIILN